MSMVYCATCDDLHDRFDTCEAYEQNVNRQMRAIFKVNNPDAYLGGLLTEAETEAIDDAIDSAIIASLDDDEPTILWSEVRPWDLPADTARALGMYPLNQGGNDV